MTERYILFKNFLRRVNIITKEEKKAIKEENKKRIRELKEYLKKPENKELKKYVRSCGRWAIGGILSSVITGVAIYDNVNTTKNVEADKITKVYDDAINFENERLAKGDITQEEHDKNVEDLQKECQKKLKKNNIFSTVKGASASMFCGMTGGLLAYTMIEASDSAIKRAMNDDKQKQEAAIKGFIKGAKKSE